MGVANGMWQCMTADAGTVAEMLLFELQPKRYKNRVTAGILVKY